MACLYLLFHRSLFLVKRCSLKKYPLLSYDKMRFYLDGLGTFATKGDINTPMEGQSPSIGVSPPPMDVAKPHPNPFLGEFSYSSPCLGEIKVILYD